MFTNRDPLRTGEVLPLNNFSWASQAPGVVGVAAVNNMLKRCLVAAVDHAIARRREYDYRMGSIDARCG